jgi:hypothetical protein
VVRSGAWSQTSCCEASFQEEVWGVLAVNSGRLFGGFAARRFSRPSF